jgi:hypothetical protein
VPLFIFSFLKKQQNSSVVQLFSIFSVLLAIIAKAGHRTTEKSDRHYQL